MKLTGAKSVCTGADSVCTATKSLGTGAKSVGTGAESVCTEFKSLGTVAVGVLPPIVPVPTAESRAAGWLNQRWDGMRIGSAHRRALRCAVNLLRSHRHARPHQGPQLAPDGHTCVSSGHGVGRGDTSTGVSNHTRANRTVVGEREVAHRRCSSTSCFEEQIPHRSTCQPPCRERLRPEHLGSRRIPVHEPPSVPDREKIIPT